MNETKTNTNPEQRLVINYLKLRRYIGYLGMGLPVILMIGVAILDQEEAVIQYSISSYYYTRLGNVFVGILVAVGVFLHAYKGHDKRDNLLASTAAILVVVVALVPTSSTDHWQETVHLTSAALFFLILAYFSYFLFTKTDLKNPGTQKLRRNKIYRICGIAIVACLVSIGIFSSILGDFYYHLKLTFWFEALALWAFGFSWLTKGEAILSDEE